MKKRTKARTKKRTSKKEALVNWFKALSVAKKVLFVLATVFIGLVLFTVVSDRVDQWRLERDFREIEVTMSALRDDTKDSYPSVKLGLSKYCYKQSVKIGSGDLYCAVDLKTVDYPRANGSSLIDSRYFLGATNQRLVGQGVLSQKAEGVEIYKIKKDIVCRLDYRLDQASPKDISVAKIHCYSKSSRPIFPLL